MNKVDALADNVEFKTGIRPTTIHGKYDKSMAVGMDIVIMAVDSMDVRREIADTAKPRLAIIDGRM
jgi:predicted nuclease with TOPRIM domain